MRAVMEASRVACSGGAEECSRAVVVVVVVVGRGVVRVCRERRRVLRAWCCFVQLRRYGVV